MGTEELIQKIKASSVDVDGKLKLSCAKAFKIHEEQDVPLKEIGAVCDSQKIKIMNCQLGCFK